MILIGCSAARAGRAGLHPRRGSRPAQSPAPSATSPSLTLALVDATSAAARPVPAPASVAGAPAEEGGSEEAGLDVAPEDRQPTSAYQKLKTVSPHAHTKIIRNITDSEATLSYNFPTLPIPNHVFETEAAVRDRETDAADG
jgi:hypothetical protein